MHPAHAVAFAILAKLLGSFRHCTLSQGYCAVQKAKCFLFKQVMTLIPVTIIIYQIVIHQGDTWHDEDALHCGACDNELEVRWSYCPACGEPREGAVMSVEAAEEQGMTLTVEEGELVQVGGVEMMSTNVPKLPVSSKDPVIHLHYQMPSSASLEKK